MLAVVVCVVLFKRGIKMGAITPSTKNGSAWQNILVTFIIATVSIHEILGIQSETGKPRTKKLLVIVLEGFRWNYLQDVPLQGLGFAKIMNIGSKAHHLKPVFPTTTFPNLNSIITGLYPENHGFVSDVMYDYQRRTFFHSPSSVEDYWWNETSPIWITATKYDKRTALYMWPGCEVKIKNLRPAFCHSSSSREFAALVFEKNLHDILIRMSKNEVDFGLLFTEYFDVIGHHFGPGSLEHLNAVRLVNTIMEEARNEIQNSSTLRKEVNLIIMSDFGMTAYPQEENQHTISDIVALDDIEYVTGSGVIVGFYPKADKLAKVYGQLHNVSWAHVWKRDDIPEHFHVKWHNHTAPILVVTKSGHVILPISDTNYLSKQVPPELLLPGQKAKKKGNHGYDPEEVSDMNGIFLIEGPDFRKNVTVHEVKIVDVYNMMTCVLNITAQPNNGSWSNICGFMVSDCNGNCKPRSGGASGKQICTTGFIIVIIAFVNTLIRMNV